MDKKILVMVMVPVLVVMSGALAFSAFTGNITTNVNATAGFIGWQENVTGTYVHMDNTAVKLTYTNGSTPSYSQTISTVSLGVTNLAPGNWAVFNITVTNTGSVGIELSGATTTTTTTPNTLSASSVTSTSFVWGQNLSGNGYEYYVNEMASGSLDHGSSTSFQVFVGLGDGSQNAYQSSSMTLDITITVTSDP